MKIILSAGRPTCGTSDYTGAMHKEHGRHQIVERFLIDYNIDTLIRYFDNKLK